MLKPDALAIAKPYLIEEEHIFERLLKNHERIKKMDVCMVGGAVLPYLYKSLVFAQKYVAVDPFMDLAQLEKHIKINSKIQFFDNTFEEYILLKKNETNRIYFFWFNVASYIPNLSTHLKFLLQKGDVVILSGWANTEPAKNLFGQYFEHLGESDKQFLSLDTFPLDSLCPLYLEKFYGQYANINIIYK